MWKRICPNCNNEVEYTKRNSYNKAVKLNRICLRCSNKKNRRPYAQKLATEAIAKKRMEVARQEFFAGKLFGGRTVISDDIKTGVEVGRSKNSEWYVQMQCECGKEEWVRINAIRQRKADLCVNCRSLRDRSPTFIGYKDMPGGIMSRIKNSSNARKHTKNTINFDAQYIYELFHSQNCKCKFTNMPLDWSTASLDRIDSTRGYEMGNVQWVHKKVNLMKLDMTDTEFVNWCKLIVGNLI
jgi:hypothetical protein